MGLLSGRFETLSETLGAFNDSVIAIKKVFYGISGLERFSDQDMTEHSLNVRSLLEKSLRVLIDPDCYLSEEDIAAQLVADGLKERRRGDTDDLIEEIKQTMAHLQSGWQDLDDEDLLLLDSICWLIDSEASLTFRRIWKR